MRVLVIGDSGGIGAALAEAAIRRGAEVTGLSRRRDGFDVTDEASVAAGLAALDGPFDTVLVATGALAIDGRGPEKGLRSLEPQTLLGSYAINAIGPALVLKHAARLLPRDRRAVFAALSARVGSIGDNRAGGWYGYRAAKAGLNQLIRTGSIEMARTHPKLICVLLHPGTVATGLSREFLARHSAVAPEAAASRLWTVIDGLTSGDTGRFFDWAGQPVRW